MKLRPFELGLVAVFVVLALLSLLFLSSGSIGSRDEEFTVGKVTIWGTLDSSAISPVISSIADDNDAYAGVSYRQVDINSFSSQFTNALADGVGPDIVLISHEQLVELRRRIAPISYESFPIRDIRSNYIDGAEIFALQDGLYAYPLAVDPLMLYWNRDLLAQQNLLSAPDTWEALVANYVPALTDRDFNRNIIKSSVALGEYQNIQNAFGIVSMLLIQSGSRLVEEEGVGGYAVKLDQSVSGGRPLISTVDFYTRFSRPNNSLYSWNRTFSSDRQRFLSEDLAMYFGLGSEGREIERQNPNLSFDIAEVPQGASASLRRTYGKFYGLSLVRNSSNPNGAANVMSLLASATYAPQISQRADLVPVLRTAVSAGSNDTYGRLTYRSAAIAYGWLNPTKSQTDTIFTTMMRDVTEGRFDETISSLDAINKLELQYN